MAALNAINILQVIKSGASQYYKDNVPDATKDNISKVGEIIAGSSTLTGEFIEGICSKIAVTNFQNKVFKNPLSIFKKNDTALGNFGNIEDIYIAPAEDRLTSTNAGDLLKEENAKGIAAYYALNRKSTMKKTFNENTLRNAFRNESSFMNLYTEIVNSIYSGDNITEFNLLKNTLGAVISNNHCYVEYIAGTTEPKELAKMISQVAKAFTFPSKTYANYNAQYLKENPEGKPPVVTWTDESDICIILPAAIQTEIDYEVLASAFNLSVVDVRKKTILVDEIPSGTGTVAAVVLDRNALKCVDAKFKPMTFTNPETDSITFYLHHWQYYYVSQFCNMCAFVLDSE